jgi:hypothetical protein
MPLTSGAIGERQKADWDRTVLDVWCPQACLRKHAERRPTSRPLIANEMSVRPRKMVLSVVLTRFRGERHSERKFSGIFSDLPGVAVTTAQFNRGVTSDVAQR